ncbi:hypothetical protein CKAN_00893400 [Cinnamomum micranthum f. kanehirae]|uniref:Transposase-associated domain-containing protein n=1 Tax=Cinnamomum micranthum f. kanehirae TaxID=337451 RepID=A0A3S3MHX9_9MAGN|nr:hypothetical protein CKAN_00893400 [Cinnamomum micranthum f. kanehirae]
MDRNWILHYQNRFSAEYIAGVNSFIDFAKANSGGAVLINCPCNDCCNHRKHDYITVRNHLHIQGMMVSYLRWIYHGEPIVQPNDSDESDDESKENQGEYDKLIEDHRRETCLEEDTQERDDVQDFENLLKASQRGLYPGCRSSDTLLRDLSMGYKNIDACKHNCVLYWKENAQLDKCPECEEPRYKVNDGKRKKIPHKIADMPRDKRVKRVRSIAAALKLARVESTPEASTQPPPVNLLVTRSGGSGSTPALVAIQPLPIQPPTTHLSLTQPQPSQPLLSLHTVGSNVASAPVSEVPSRVRGVTRGKSATKLRRQLGHNIPVSIPISSHRPEGEHAPSLVNHLGLAIREVAPIRPHGWKKLDSGIKLAVIAAVRQIFDIGDYEGDMQLRADIDRQCGVLYKSWKYQLHSYYLELLEQGVPQPQDHPAEGCDPADWQLMVSQCWESPAWKAKSKKAKESRAKLPYNHTSGSRSFASRMSLMMAQNAGQAPPITKFFHDTHYRQNSNELVNEVAQQRHEASVQQIEEQSQSSVTALMTQEQIVVGVLGKRSGYLNGHGIYTKTSSSSTQSRAPHHEVIALREQLAEQTTISTSREGPLLLVMVQLMEIMMRPFD